MGTTLKINSVDWLNCFFIIWIRNVPDCSKWIFMIKLIMFSSEDDLENRVRKFKVFNHKIWRKDQKIEKILKIVKIMILKGSRKAFKKVRRFVRFNLNSRAFSIENFRDLDCEHVRADRTLASSYALNKYSVFWNFVIASIY